MKSVWKVCVDTPICSRVFEATSKPEAMRVYQFLYDLVPDFKVIMYQEVRL